MSEKRELTKSEKKKMIEYYNEGCKIGTSIHADGYDEKAVEDAITEIYASVSLPTPMIIWGDSPVDCIIKKRKITGESLDDQEVRNEAVSNCWFGQHEVYWVIFYRFCHEQLGINYDPEDEKKLYLWDTLAKNCNWWYPYDTHCFVSRKPLIVSMEPNGQFEMDGEKAWDIYQLHNELGPAIAFADSLSLYCIHGVQVPDWLVGTPADKLDARKLISISNAEVRREFVKKVTIERVYKDLGGESIDFGPPDEIGGPYELVLLDFGDGRKREYLKMLNPSIGTWHLEGIQPGIKTVEEAKRWRRYGVVQDPAVLT
jgi:hypothetical protein